ncbi:MAG: sulfurase [Gemmatimonadetes bacterium]|nr:sulfurase [Gemmatimonadota bacterium]
MAARESARLVAGRGLEGNANQGGWRQITIIEREVWDRQTAALGVEVDPAARRANLLVRGFPLAGTRGRTIRIGECRIRIRGETKPCHILDDAAHGLLDALRHDWGGGAFGEVLDDGEIRVGDPVVFVEDEAMVNEAGRSS